jgi:hypothetical protein
VPLQTDYPSGLSGLVSEDAWGLEGAPNKIAAVATNDGDSSIVYADSGGAVRIQTFTFPLIAGVADPVNDSDLYARARRYKNGAGGQVFAFYSNGASVGANKHVEIGAAVPGYALVTHSLGAVALAALNTTHGFYITAAGGPSNKFEVWVTEFYRTVDYSYPAGDAGEFAHLIGSLMAAIGANLLARDMMALARSIYRRTGILIKPAEYDEAIWAWGRERHVALVGA